MESSCEPLLVRAARWAGGLYGDDLPPAVKQALRAGTMSTLGAAYWTLSHPVGSRLVDLIEREHGGSGAVGSPALWPTSEPVSPTGACRGLAALSMALDFDDTILGGHTGHSALIVPLVYGEELGVSGERIRVAQAAASEVAARLASAAAIGPFRGQQTAYMHGIAAAVGRGVVEGLDPERIAHAAALVLGQPPWPLTDAFLGSDAKIMTASEPIGTGLRAVEWAREGFRGNPRTVEGEEGFLAAFSEYPLPGFFETLGTRWHLPTLTVKVYPGCAYVTAAVHAALRVRETFGRDLRPDDVRTVEVRGSLFTTKVQQLTEPYVRGPESPLAALNFSVPYNAAVALVDGEHTPRQFQPDRVEDPSLWSLADRVEVVHETDLTLAALTSEVPVGAMLEQVGWRAFPYALKTVGPMAVLMNLPLFLRLIAGSSEMSLEGAEKNMGAEVSVTLRDGSSERHRCERPPGFAGDGLESISDHAERKLREAVEAGADAEQHRLPAADALVSWVKEMGHRGPAPSRLTEETG